MKTFGQWLTWGRRNLHFRLEDLANKICKSDNSSISVTYLSDLEHDRRVPSEYLLPQFAMHLQIPLDLLYYSLGKLPPDIRGTSASDEQILDAIQTFRQALVPDTSDAHASLRTYENAASDTKLSRYNVLKDRKSGLFERWDDPSTAA